MRKYTEEKLSGAMTDPCPICQLKPARGINFQGLDAGASEGAYTVCFGCGLVQVIRDGIRCALTEDEAAWLFYQPDLVDSVLAIARLRAVNPMRVGEMVREQKEREK